MANKVNHSNTFDYQIKFLTNISKLNAADIWSWKTWSIWKKLHSFFVTLVLLHIIVFSIMTMVENWGITEELMYVKSLIKDNKINSEGSL